ncbi:aspartokinase 2, chloroplastic isoform X2 [Physcomitrium patens]|uniref:aspartate kinase n=1 Tax=Physcomitrium patens TaxID=3218 RepID=A0A2K1ILX6_PHYPA|nr:aspartokinase 2, chloroplastic-like isoform X2 [Physcomitrium patens]PNR30282.1 hypothetical protein PHYPA_026598 [Physcomitrium patens]|eukprot:XP_024360187.1 aspartokinase 2, chloroplastic-like isoform X2 [Physcomitrella patens]
MMEAVAAMAVSSLVFIAPTSSSCGCSGIQYRALNLAHTARGRGLESSSSLYFFGGKLQTWKFVENAAKWRNAAGSLRVRCDAGVALVEQRVEEEQKQRLSSDFTTVMKFGGSSVASAHRMREVAQLILSFPDERPVIVLSAMGKTTNNLLKAGEKAVSCGVEESGNIEELQVIRDLHKTTARELKVDESLVTELFEELEQLVMGIALMKELTLRTKDYLVSFGERLSTRLFTAYLNSIGTYARQYDAFDLGIITTDEFTNAEILEVTYPTVRERLLKDLKADADRGTPICVVTGFLGKGVETGCVTTLGRGGSDLTATALGKALGLREIQVWKDVDGVLTCDPRVYSNALPVPFLTFDEASELAYFGAQVLHPQSMRPARDANIPVRVKNSYNPQAPGTLITGERDMSEAEMTSIVLKKDVTMLDIQSTRMLGQVGFLAKVFTTFEHLGISVDVVATSEVSISLTLDPSKLWERELIEQELDKMKSELSKIANVQLLKKKSIISLISNVKQSSAVLEKVFRVFKKNDINVQMISQGASKVNISMVVDDDDAPKCVQELHKVFWPDADEATERNGHV